MSENGKEEYAESFKGFAFIAAIMLLFVIIKTLLDVGVILMALSIKEKHCCCAREKESTREAKSEALNAAADNIVNYYLTEEHR